MADVITIPLTTVPPGAYRFPSSGGQPVADTDSGINLEISRTVPGGLNAAAGVTITVAAYQSADGGTTWHELGACTFPSGQIGDGGSPDTTSGFITSLFPGRSRQVYGTVLVTGSSVAVEGTLTMS